MSTVNKILEEFERLKAEQGISVPLTTQQAIELSLQAGYNTGFEEGYEAAKRDIMAKLGEELANRG